MTNYYKKNTASSSFKARPTYASLDPSRNDQPDPSEYAGKLGKVGNLVRALAVNLVAQQEKNLRPSTAGMFHKARNIAPSTVATAPTPAA